MDASIVADVINLVVIDLVLSGDNAVVIALAVHGLPRDMARKATLWGAAGAVLLRVVFASIAALLLNVPLLQAIGGVVLFWIAWKLLTDEDEDATPGQQITHFRHAVRTIILADVVMSLDNILAVGGASHGHLGLLLLGLAISIPLVLWGSTLLARLVERAPWLTYVGAGVLAWVAGGMICIDAFVRPHLEFLPEWTTRWAIPAFCAIAICGGGWLYLRREHGEAPEPPPSEG